MNISVNKSAPVFSSSEITIESATGKVWDTLTEIRKWPEWQPSVTEVSFEGPLSEGVEFRWKAGGIAFKSRIHTVKPGEMFGWTGKAIGAFAIHNWRFSGQNNVTTVRVEESLQGILPALFKTFFQKNLEKGMLKNLAELKAASEPKR